MKKIILLLLISFFLAACSRQANKNFIVINNKKINVEIADTPKLQYHGLSSRNSICGNCGMLFTYPDKNKRMFVMRNMNFPLDIIWIRDNKVVKISRNLRPENDKPIMQYSSDIPVNYVLEVNADFCWKNNIRAGDKVKFNLQ